MTLPAVAARIREATAADLPGLRDLERRAAAAFAGTPHADLADVDEADLVDAATLELARARGDVLVADVDGEPVGFALLAIVDGAPHLAEMDVVPEAAGRGVGSALLDAIVERLRRRGAAGLSLTTFRDVPFNAPFYARRGFVELPPAEVGPDLAAVLAAEVDAGFLAATRCAMRLDLRAPGLLASAQDDRAQ